MSRYELLASPVPLVPVTRGDHEQSSNSPTKSTTRVRWLTLHEWTSLPTDLYTYFSGLAVEEMLAKVATSNYRTGMDERRPDANPTDELTLAQWLTESFTYLHNRVTIPHGAAHPHAKIVIPAPQFLQAGKVDYVFACNRRACGVMELKTFWKVTSEQIDQVIDGTAPLTGSHYGRLALEQSYGYLVHNGHKFGVLTTVNGWVFLMRLNFGQLYVSRMISCDVRLPNYTVLQILYYITALMAQTPELEETFVDGTPVSLYLADARVTIPAPRVPGAVSPMHQTGDFYVSSQMQHLDPIPPLRRYNLEPWVDPPKVIFQPWKEGNSLGKKTFLLTLPSDKTIVAKMWDGHKESPEARDHEVSIYMRLSSLWHTVVPRLIGCSEIDFFHSLLIERLDAQQFGAAIMDDEVEKNVNEAFVAIHKVGVLHGDIRRQNVMIREDRSVVIIDFEHSIYSDDLSTARIREENDEIESMLMEAREEKAAFTKSKVKQEH